MERIVYLKKRKRVSVHVIITETDNNVFIAIVTLRGRIVVRASSGQMNVQKRHTPLSVELLGTFIGKHLAERGIMTYGLFIYGYFTKLVKSAIRGLRKYRIMCRFVKICDCIPHNGVRLTLPKRK